MLSSDSSGLGALVGASVHSPELLDTFTRRGAVSAERLLRSFLRCILGGSLRTRDGDLGTRSLLPSYERKPKKLVCRTRVFRCTQ